MQQQTVKLLVFWCKQRHENHPALHTSKIGLLAAQAVSRQLLSLEGKNFISKGNQQLRIALFTHSHGQHHPLLVATSSALLHLCAMRLATALYAATHRQPYNLPVHFHLDQAWCDLFVLGTHGYAPCQGEARHRRLTPLLRTGSSGPSPSRRHSSPRPSGHGPICPSSTSRVTHGRSTQATCTGHSGGCTPARSSHCLFQHDMQ